jgi:hypothetical protein
MKDMASAGTDQTTPAKVAAKPVSRCRIATIIPGSFLPA